MYKTFTKNGIHFKYARKIFLIMRLTTVFILAAIMQVSASTYGQRITLNEKNAFIGNVLDKIRQQSGYGFIADQKVLANTIPININLKNVSLEEALKAIFSNQQLSYKIDDKAIVLIEKREFVNTSVPVQDSLIFKGKVVDEKGEGLAGATVKVKGSNKRVYSTLSGEFAIYAPVKGSIVVTYVGYADQEIDLSKQNNSDWIKVDMSQALQNLGEVNVVSTGYQTLPKERATGSFELIDNKLFNRTTGPDVINRLLATVPGVLVKVNNNNQSSITIRGISTLSLDDLKPLIILDNIPYEGDVSNLNPNDVENITILKDAAAASIWGTRAGNGVIVITTKKGKFNSPTIISLNANTTIIEKPDLFSLPIMNSSEVIDLEKYLFGQGYYNDKIDATYQPPFLTPVVELLLKQRNLPLSDVSGRMNINDQINSYKVYDIRNDYLKYINRKPISQQYAINLSGGGEQIAYNFSGSFDKILGSVVTSKNNRNTLRSNVTIKPIKNLTINTSILYTSTEANEAYNFDPYSVYQYARLTDDHGNPATVGGSGSLRTSYLDSISANTNLLDVRYKPLEDINKSRNYSKTQDLLFNIGIKYDFNKNIHAEVNYQHEITNSLSNQIDATDSYLTKQLINQFTNPNTYERAIPLGAIYSSGNSNFKAQTLRGSINVDKTWNDEHQFVAIAGAEAKKNSLESILNGRLYGFDERTKAYQNVDTKNPVPTYDGGEALIESGGSINNFFNRFTSLFANASYTYLNRYTISGSARKDASNVFGDNANKRNSPLWSAGLSWNINEETFFKSETFTLLRFRATYGYSGNVVSGVPAYAIVSYPDGKDPITGLPYAITGNPPNPNLRWEKVGQYNLGLDFGVFKNRVAGSIELYRKNSKDVVAQIPVDLISGSRTQTRNTASLRGTGMDLTINSINFNISNFRWNTSLIYSFNRVITAAYKQSQSSTTFFIAASNSLNPVEGKDVNSIFAYKWAGLDPSSGDPQGYLNGNISKDYNALIRVPIKDLEYFGSGVPRQYGSVRNSFIYKKVEMSLNIIYKFDYFFRRTGINFSDLFERGQGHSEYADRWQNPGDELVTNVPSLIYPGDYNRDFFYNRSAAMIEKGDHIRLQDITMSYTLPKLKGIRNLRLYGNISNIGIVWRANKAGLDPDNFASYRTPRAYSIGLNADF